MPVDQFKARIRDLMSKGRTQAAIQESLNYLKGTYLENDITQLSANFQQAERERLLGTASPQESMQSLARVNNSLLNLLDQVAEEINTERRQNLPETSQTMDQNSVSGNPDKQEKPSTEKNHLLPAGIGVGLLLLIIGLLVFIPCPSNSQFTVFRIALSLGAAGLAAIIPGFFKIALKAQVQAGGALAVLVLVYLVNPATAVVSKDQCNGPFDLTIFLENADGVTELKSEGKLVLRLANDRREEYIDIEGSVSFKQLPAQAQGDSVPVELNAPGWQFSNGKSNTLVALIGLGQTLIIQRDSALYCCIAGVVRDPGNKPLSGVTLDILGVLDTSDTQGRFELVIPVAKQAESYTLTATHPRYKLFDVTVYPATRTEVKILMQK